MIAEKIHKIMHEVGHIQRDVTLDTRAGSYKVTSEAAVLKTLRPKLLEHGLILVPESTSAERAGNVTTLTVSWKLTDIQDSEVWTLGSVGQGSDSQDKGAGMAMTYALKYLLLKMFLMEQGDDPDYQTSESVTEDIEATEALFHKANKLTTQAHRDGLLSDPKFATFVERLEDVQKQPTRLQKAINNLSELYTSAGKEVPEV